MSLHRAALLSLALFSVLACDAPSEPSVDAGPSLDAGRDASVEVCASNADCDDGRFCNGQERCEPGGAASAPNGCRAGDPPCAASEECLEDSDTCRSVDCTDPDRDGDGSNAEACGGDDCDDGDPRRYPGNPEVCDAEGLDEDCDPTTVGSTDADGDGAVSSVCCNGSSCGPDCNDADVNINPAASESCDGVDNDCNGAPDDAAGLCPGGVCAAGVCDFAAWARTIGSSAADFTDAVAIDSLGAVYVLGTVAADSNLGDGGAPRSLPSGAMFVTKFAADGAHEWTYQSPAPSCTLRELRPYDGASFTDRLATELDLAVTSDGSVVVTGNMCADFGSGDAGSEDNPGFVLVLSPTGAYVRDQRFTCTGAFDRCGVSLSGVGNVGSGYGVVGSFRGTVDFGAGARTTGDFDRHGVVLTAPSATAALAEHTVLSKTGTSSARILPSDIVGRAGELTIAGSYGTTSSGSIGVDVAGLTLAAASRASFVLRGPIGVARPDWAKAITPTRYAGLAVDGGGLVHLAVVSRDFAVDSTSVTGAAPVRGYLVTLSDEGAYVRHVAYTNAQPAAVAVDSGDRVSVAGTLFGVSDFGGGSVAPATGSTSNGFLVTYRVDGRFNASTLFGFTDSASTVGARALDVAVGPGNSTAVGGEFSGRVRLTDVSVSLGQSDLFVFRLGT